MKQPDNKQYNPDGEENTRTLGRMFPGLYPCARCVLREDCDRYLRCHKWRLFFHVSWEECCRTVKGDGNENK